MPTSARRQRPFAAAAIAALSCLGLTAQQGPAPAAAHHLVRSYPADKDTAIAVVGSRTLTLGDLIHHIGDRHYPGFEQAMARGDEAPHLQRMLQSDLIAPWVRHFADLEALRQTAGDEQLGAVEIDPEKLEAAQSQALKQSFEAWLQNYVESLRQQGRPTDLSQRRVNSLLADFQLKNGLTAELQGMLALLEPDDFSVLQLRNFYNDHGRYFGGQVTIAHILVQNRDAGTGILLDDEGIARANARLADIRARLRPDGSNFEDLARLFSDDTRTAKDGGVLPNIRRFDERLPATLCRAAWQLRDGEVGEDVVETPYGWHLIKRTDFAQHYFFLFTDDTIPTVREVMQRAAQEERLIRAREITGLRLLL